MTSKNIKMPYLILVCVGLTTFTSCGQIESSSSQLPPNPAEAMPNADVPLTASANDYFSEPTVSIQDRFCQGGLGDGPKGQIQICCSPSTTKEDVVDQSLVELQECEKSFSLQSAGCALETQEGVMKGKLWSCEAPEYASYFAEVPASQSQPMSSAIVAAPEGFEWFGKRKREEARQQARVEHILQKIEPIDLMKTAPVPARALKTASIDPAMLVPTTYFELSNEAEILGRLPKKAYLKFQMEYVGKTYPACNFFLTTALCMAGYCQTDKPLYVAAHYDTYFYKKGWDLIKLPELKRMFKSGEHFDAVIQLDPVRKGRPGHVAIPIGLDDRERVVIAQGNLGTVTNEVKSVNDSFITHWKGGFSIFVKRNKPLAAK